MRRNELFLIFGMVLLISFLFGGYRDMEQNVEKQTLEAEDTLAVYRGDMETAYFMVQIQRPRRRTR